VKLFLQIERRSACVYSPATVLLTGISDPCQLGGFRSWTFMNSKYLNLWNQYFDLIFSSVFLTFCKQNHFFQKVKLDFLIKFAPVVHRSKNNCKIIALAPDRNKQEHFFHNTAKYLTRQSVLVYSCPADVRLSVKTIIDWNVPAISSSHLEIEGPILQNRFVVSSRFF
jgi:hypothetical protein